MYCGRLHSRNSSVILTNTQTPLISNVILKVFFLRLILPETWQNVIKRRDQNSDGSRSSSVEFKLLSARRVITKYAEEHNKDSQFSFTEPSSEVRTIYQIIE